MTMTFRVVFFNSSLMFRFDCFPELFWPLKRNQVLLLKKHVHKHDDFTRRLKSYGYSDIVMAPNACPRPSGRTGHRSFWLKNAF